MQIVAFWFYGSIVGYDQINGQIYRGYFGQDLFIHSHGWVLILWLSHIKMSKVLIDADNYLESRINQLTRPCHLNIFHAVHCFCWFNNFITFSNWITWSLPMFPFLIYSFLTMWCWLPLVCIYVCTNKLLPNDGRYYACMDLLMDLDSKYF